MKEKWYKRLAKSCKKEVITGRTNVDEPYINRYKVFDLYILRMYIHEILRGDDDEDFHTHPSFFFHYILEGRYIEETFTGKHLRTIGHYAFRTGSFAHRLIFCEEYKDKPVWTFVIFGPRYQKWGFIDKKTRKWTYWKDYLNIK